jgi:hypothetical protein
MNRAVAAIVMMTLVSSCTVRTEDQEAWVGAPVINLDKHPIFLTLPVVKTRASDGTEIRNYVNGRNIGACSGNGTVFAGTIDFASYSAFSSCVSGFAACNNIFYIKGGRIQAYTPIGSGGASCYTDDRVRPNFRGATNFR